MTDELRPEQGGQEEVDCSSGKNTLTLADVEALASIPRAGTRSGNPYLPEMATVVEIIQETPNVKSFRVRFSDEEVMERFTFEPGQVGQLGIYGVGESTFAINSSSSNKDYLQFSVMQAGEVTTALHQLSVGDKVGVRAPMGRPFPVREWKGKNLLFIMGGIGSAALRATVLHCLEHRADYGDVTILYGARTPVDLTFGYDIEEWQSRNDVQTVVTVDAEFPGWEGRVGFVPTVLEELAPGPVDTIAVLCGPPIMIKFCLQVLERLQFADEQVYTTLEKRMKCGIGICGRCNVGPKYVCVDGPVFTMAELRELPDEL
jgi:NAD(P)H-flavin reductase